MAISNTVMCAICRIPDRDRLTADLKAKGTPTAIYYTIPLSRQKGYAHFASTPIPNTERLNKTVISLPMHPYLDAPTLDRIIEAVLERDRFRLKHIRHS